MIESRITKVYVVKGLRKLIIKLKNYAKSAAKFLRNSQENSLLSIRDTTDTKDLDTTDTEDPDFVDVKALMKELSVEELCQTAEEYFKCLTNYDYLLAKPFASVEEAPELLIRFSQLLRGLQIVPEMTVLDFGAGSCWTSRYLTQLGYQVIALDVSTSALKIGQELYVRQPVIGDQPAPQFLTFDGRKIDLPDCSVDRIMCFDAFHHVPNPEEVLKELGRVLKVGGIAGFSEPGPTHSKSLDAQSEMRKFKVVENDINIRYIWNEAEKAGFTKIELGVFNSRSFHLSLDEFEDYLEQGDANRRYAEATCSFMQFNRLFFLYKGEFKPDSRQSSGLAAQLSVNLASNLVENGSPFNATVSVTNTGSVIWLPTTAQAGAVHLGVHLLNQSGEVLDYNYFRYALTPGEGQAILPQETITFEMEVPSPPKGHYILEFDLVSEKICWFSGKGVQTIRANIEAAILAAQLSVNLDSNRLEEGNPFNAKVSVTNTGSITWLPTTAKVGAVHLGVHLLDQFGEVLDYDYFRHVLTPGEERAILPEETTTFEIQVPSPPKGHYILEFDLVREEICWFSWKGLSTIRVNIEVA